MFFVKSTPEFNLQCVIQRVSRGAIFAKAFLQKGVQDSLRLSWSVYVSNSSGSVYMNRWQLDTEQHASNGVCVDLDLDADGSGAPWLKAQHGEIDSCAFWPGGPGKSTESWGAW